MWIRSQDKETLTDVKHLEIKHIGDYYVIFTDNHLAPNNKCELGCYKTKEKAIKVLDEIQRFIDNKPLISVFDMPKDMIEIKPHEIKEKSNDQTR